MIFRACLVGIAIALFLPFVVLAQSFPKPTWSGPSANMRVAFTFDDGPKPEYAFGILRALNRFQVKATFFVVGKEALSYPDLIWDIQSNGHEIENHSFSHPRFDTLDPTGIRREIEACSDTILLLTGRRPLFFRPPGGRFNKLVLEVAAEEHLRVALWDVNPGDYAHNTPVSEENPSYFKTSDAIAASILGRVKNGSIILLHNGGEETIEALNIVIPVLRKRGYHFVTLEELLHPAT